ncbi:peptidase inhibitor family I36 protein [Streptomyces sp. NPDC050617]|uniref:peptidase inhibitor family I36 protein n=1 Tax=Streptomyces sp. NPDC050617 TaxID=3154628 RepID=UPI00341B4C9D
MNSKARRRAVLAFAATALALGATATSAPAATAASGYDRCPSGSSCYFSNANGNGDMWRAPSSACFNLGTMNPPFNDRISSVWNRGGNVVHMYNWTGTWTWLDDVQVGQKWSVGSGDHRNDKVDMVCIGRTP